MIGKRMSLPFFSKVLILSVYLCRRSKPSSGLWLDQPSPNARHYLMRLAVHVDINDVPVGSVDHDISGYTVQSTSTNDGRPEETPQPLGNHQC